MAITFRGAGTGAEANNAAVSPTLFETATAGDLLLVYAMISGGAGRSLSVSGSMTEAYSGSSTAKRKDYLWYKIASGGETGFTVTPSGGATNEPVVAMACSFRGVNTTSPVDSVAADTNINTDTQDIGPITAATPTASGGMVVVVGAKEDNWTSVATLTGDGLTWAEIAELSSVIGSDCSIVWDYAIWSGAAPTLTSKTFVVTGGAVWPAGGCMVTFNPEPAAGQPLVKRLGGTPFAARNVGVW